MAVPNTIVIRGRDAERYDGVADGAITPGMLIEPTGTTETDLTYAAHSTAGGAAGARFALAGKAGRSISDDYADGEYIEYKHFLGGDEAYALLAAGENASVGETLESAGDGTLQVVDGTAPDHAVAVATEPVDNSGGSGAVRIIAEVI